MDLYNKHRPRLFKDMYPTSKFIQHGDQIVANSVEGKSPELSHFIIFHSEHGGLGKTTAGRIIAVGLNPDCTPKEADEIMEGMPNPMFFEINGGNYRKIDDARKLEKEIEYQRHGLFTHKKVYMINEAHNLRPETQEVFLQLTENIPNNIYIIFTVTRLDKLDDKLAGRAQKYRFYPPEKADLRKLLLDIEGKERGTGIPEYIVDQIFERSGVSIRDSINTLGEYLITGEVTPGENEQEDRPIYSEILRALEVVALGKPLSWTNNLMPMVQELVNTVQAEEARIKLTARLLGLITNPRGIKGEGNNAANSMKRKAELYRRLIPRFSTQLSFQQKTDLILMLYSAFMDAKDISEEANMK